MIKVLIVDDDRLVRKGLISAMPWEQFDMKVVGEASNGAKALEFIEEESIELLLTDLEMPVMSGIELMRAVRQKHPHIHIVVLTLHQEFEYVQEALRLGAIDYIAKIQLEKERFDEVLQRIYNRIQEHNRIDFYSGKSHLEQFNRDDERKSESHHEGMEQSIEELKERWLSLEWVYNEALFRKLLEECKRMNLPETRLLGMLFFLVEEWNQTLVPMFSVKAEMQSHYECWSDVEQWLTETRQRIGKAMDKSAFSSEVVDCVMRSVRIIHDEFEHQITAIEVAKRVNLSRSYFSRCFKMVTGKTFNDYIRQVRIDKAKEYLQHTNKTISWVAENIGYLDEKYFSRIFREHTGMLPSEYRVQAHTGRILSDSRVDK
jgi:two-component system response regulator YesN